MASDRLYRYEIEDPPHGEVHGTFDELRLAEEEIGRISQVPYGIDPNQPPSAYPAREWHIIEYAMTSGRWVEVRRKAVLDVAPSGLIWHESSWVTSKAVAPTSDEAVSAPPDSDPLAASPLGGANAPAFVHSLGNLLKTVVDALRF
jgi:hypothetical protein